MALTLRWTAFAVSALTSLFAAWLFILLARADGWTSLEDFRGIRRDRMVLQSQIRRPEGDDYQGGYEVVEGYATPEQAARV